METESILKIVIETVTPFLNKQDDFLEDTEILESGLIDSLNILQVIAELERRFSLKIGPLDMTFDDFKTCRTISIRLEKLIGVS